MKGKENLASRTPAEPFNISHAPPLQIRSRLVDSESGKDLLPSKAGEGEEGQEALAKRRLLAEAAKETALAAIRGSQVVRKRISRRQFPSLHLPMFLPDKHKPGILREP